MRLLVLGSGTSTGVPRIGNDWGACDPQNPKNRRSRVSIIVEGDDGRKVLVDTSTDLRQQLLDNGIEAVDAVVWTHDHADHCHGIDDLRVMRYGRGGPIPGYASDETVRRLRQRFGYVFSGQYGYPTIVNIDRLDRVRLIAGMDVTWCQVPHGPTESTAFRFSSDVGSIGYATDISAITRDLIDLMHEIDVLVVDCLRREPHPTHAHLAMALELAERSGARRTVLTHLDKSMDYATLDAETPDTVEPAFDGMEIVL